MNRGSLLFIGLAFAPFISSAQAAKHQPTFAKQAIKKQKENLTVVSLRSHESESANISIDAKEGQKLHFYIFDLEGTLVHQSVLKNREKNIVQHVEKGIYTYTVFANDESIEEGKLIVK
ncbi:MAG: T9SS type A sorting domain-containing protein [Bacteroidota bacterium]